MVNFDIEELRRWQLEGDRTVVIRLGVGEKEDVEVYCHDYSINIGQCIDKSVDELDFKKELERINRDRLKWIEGLKED